MPDRRPAEFAADLPDRAFYRILDANANRAGEGLRTLEEWARFVQNDVGLTTALKQLRHDLTMTLERLPRHQLLASRDTPGDVGTAVTTESERTRTGAGQIVAAATSRVLQSLRCLEEYGKVIDPQFSAGVEALRYRGYTLFAVVETSATDEEHVSLSRWRRDRLQRSQIYVLVDGSTSEESFACRIAALSKAGVDVIQLRDPRLTDLQKFQRSVVARRVLGRWSDHPSRALFIVNDRPDIAVAADADGVHVGQDEIPLEHVRRLIGPRRLMGWSTHDLDQVRQALQSGADYIGCGPVFPGRTKQFDAFPGTQFLRAAADLMGKVSSDSPEPATAVPAFAIGGIHADNVAEVQAAGFQRIAVTAALQGEHDLVDRVTKLRSMLGPSPRNSSGENTIGDETTGDETTGGEGVAR